MKTTIKDVSKLYIQQLIKRYTKQMEFILFEYNVAGKAEKLTALMKVKRKFEFFKDRNMEAHCRLVVSMQQDLLMIMPEKPAFRAGWEEKLNDLISYCKAKING